MASSALGAVIGRVGRRNRYVINRDRAMRHPQQLDHEIGELLDLLHLEEPS